MVVNFLSTCLKEVEGVIFQNTKGSPKLQVFGKILLETKLDIIGFFLPTNLSQLLQKRTVSTKFGRKWVNGCSH